MDDGNVFQCLVIFPSAGFVVNTAGRFRRFLGVEPVMATDWPAATEVIDETCLSFVDIHATAELAGAVVTGPEDGYWVIRPVAAGSQPSSQQKGCWQLGCHFLGDIAAGCYVLGDSEAGGVLVSVVEPEAASFQGRGEVDGY